MPTPSHSGKAVAKSRPAPAPAAQTRSKEKAPAKKASSIPQLAPGERLRYISEAAYFIAERHGFTAGSELEDWLRAEREIDRLLSAPARRSLSKGSG